MIDDEPFVEVQDLAVEEICELLAEAGAAISAGQAAELARFVQAAGGMDEALAALAELAARRAA